MRKDQNGKWSGYLLDEPKVEDLDANGKEELMQLLLDHLGLKILRDRVPDGYSEMELVPKDEVTGASRW